MTATKDGAEPNKFETMEVADDLKSQYRIGSSDFIRKYIIILKTIHITTYNLKTVYNGIARKDM